jgi:hypothetical protein
LACARAIAGISVTSAIPLINNWIFICLSFPIEPLARLPLPSGIEQVTNNNVSRACALCR